MIKVIDLFAGCGGFSVGLTNAGFIVSKAVEFDKQIARSYEVNHPNVKVYVEDIGRIDDCNHFKTNESDVIIGGPPCQGFSMAGARIRANSFIEDPRNYLFKHYLNIVKIVRPKVFVMENVKGILTMNKGRIFEEIKKSFSDAANFDGDRYFINHRVIKASDYGIPQKRERVVIFGTLNKNIDIDEYIEKSRIDILTENSSFFDNVSIWDAISNLEQAENQSKQTPQSAYQKELASESKVIYNHTVTNHSLRAIERMAKIESGENWTSLNEDIKSVHSGSYGRMIKNDVSATITTRFDTPSGGKFIHPSKNRTITPREAARIQSFPDSFVFYGSKTSICKQIGNAVPPKLGYFLGITIKTILNENY